MEADRWEWWRRHALTISLLLTAFGIAFFVRTAWMIPLVQQFGSPDLFGGGSDSFYHYRVAHYIVQNHQNLIIDHELNFPNGAINPREPLFDWMNAILGILFAGAFGGNTMASTSFFLELQGPLWAALGVFPVYLIGKEITNRRVGVLAAFLYAVTVANIDSSTFGYANYLAFYTFFILLTIFAYLRTIRSAGTRRWVTSYRKPRDILAGLRGFVRTERAAVKWAVFAGVCFGTLALAWQGFSFFVATTVIFVVFALIVERIRRVDSFGLYVSTWIAGLVGFGMALPYYYVQGLALNWFGLPLLVFAGGLLIVLPLILLRDQPWILSIPVMIVVGGLAIGSLDFINHAQFINIVTGQGYFVKTLIYSTVAEAQAPSIDALILGYGVITFFVAFVGLALWTWRMIRGRFPRVLMFAFVFAVISIYLPISAAKFFFLGSAAFSLLPSEAFIRALDIAGLPKLRRTLGQLSERGGQLAAFRRAFKARNALILIAVVGLLVPNVWYAIDAGIPYNNKGNYNDQVYATLPPFLQTSASNASSFYLGAAGTELDTPPQYDEAGYNWLSYQDTNLPPDNRPAFVSWWDYGFQAIAQGDHPSVADNFQNGIDPSGNFLLSQNESLAIGILTTTLLVAEQRASGNPSLPAGLNAVLARDGVDLVALHTLLTQPNYDVQLVLAHPERYLAVDASHLDGENALYDAVSWELASTRTTTGMANLYDDVQAYTHWTIRYAMVDNRLFPFSGQSTGIFYAPADLTDRVISSGGIPTTYFSVSITGTDGNTYPYGQLPAGVQPTAYPITYHPAFYNTMLYHIFAGFNGTEVGQGAGIPGVSGSVAGSPPLPGWMEQHFQLVYQTAYYCPFSNPGAHPGCAQAMNLPTARVLAKAHNGSVQASMSAYASSGGEMILAYYPGQPITGTIALPDGTPVPGARVTVYDAFHIPHMTSQTGSNGVYSLILPPGNDTVNVTTGAFDPVSQADTTVLQSLNVSVSPSYGYSLSAPTLVRPIVLKPGTLTGVIYVNAAGNSTYAPTVDPLAVGASVRVWGPSGSYRATADASGTYVLDHVAPGQYNFSVVYQGTNSTNSSLGPLYAQAGKVVNRSYGIGPGTIKGSAKYPNGSAAVGAIVRVAGPTGVVTTATVDPGGNFSIANIPAGNVTVTASGGGGAYRIAPIAVALTSGGKVNESLVLVPFGTISLTVLSNGAPVGGFPVRFAPIVPFLTKAPNGSATTPPPPPPGGNGTGTPGGLPGGLPGGPGGTGPSPALARPMANGTGSGSGSHSTGPNSTSNKSAGVGETPATVNATVLWTSPDGTITASLAAGNYSVYGIGLVGSTWTAGVASASVGLGYQSLPPLEVSKALRLSGTLPSGTGAGTSSSVQVLAFDGMGNQVWTFTNTTGAWGISLPAGPYSLWAVEAPSVGHPGALAQVGHVNLTAPSTVTLPLSPATLYHPFVATSGPLGQQVPLPGATVNITAPSLGLTLTETANQSGNVTFWLPSDLGNGATICLTASFPGYAGSQTCSLTPLALVSYKLVGLSPRNLTTAVTIPGLPSGASATLNFTIPGQTAPSIVRHGGASLSLSIAPGRYQITGWTSTSGTTPVLYETLGPVNLTIPVGGPAPSVTVPFVSVVKCVGALTLPPGVQPLNVSVTLSGNGVNETVSGARFEGGLKLPTGSYTALASVSSGNRSYATFVRAAFNATGVASAPLNLLSPGVTVTFNLTLDGRPVNASALPATVSASGGLRLPVTVLGGRYVGLFPISVPLSLALHAVRILPGPDGNLALTTLSVVANPPPCVPTPPSTLCPVPLLGSRLLSAVSGQLTLPGFPGGVAGSLDFIGPGSSLARSSVTTAADGTFSISLAPGTYQIYAHSVEGSSAFANLTELIVPAVPIGPIPIQLAPAWTAVVSIVSPPGGSSATSTNLLVRAPTGILFTVPNVSFDRPTSIVLPSGSYDISANASGSPYGVHVLATGASHLALFQGNGAVSIPLAWQWQRTVQIHAPGAYVSLGNGGTARIAFSVVNTGNTPFSFHLIGSPSSYNFTFSPANATLGLSPTNDSLSGTVTVVVPAGSPVAHPPIQLEAVVNGPIGGAAGFASPAPVINLTAQYALSAGAGASANSATGPFNLSLPFYLHNPGNVAETVALTLEDVARLAGIGWTTSFSSGASKVTAPVSLAPGANSTYNLNLVSPHANALPPGTVSVVATVLNNSGGLRATVVLKVPSAAVTVTSGTLQVSGPPLGSPPTYPDWLVPVLSFVPAIALAAVLVAYRWYRTRRWVRR